jgi:hypothetical protein
VVVAVAVMLIPFGVCLQAHALSLWEMQGLTTRSICVQLTDTFHSDIIPQGNHWLFRYLFGAAMPPKISLLKV